MGLLKNPKTTFEFPFKVPEQYMTARISELSEAEPVDDQGGDIVVAPGFVGGGYE